MSADGKESLFEQMKEKVKDLVGLPPGRPLTEAELARELKAPRGTLTADDAENLPPHGGTGINPTE